MRLGRVGLALRRIPGPRNGVDARARDPRGPGPHSTLPYREATELLRCIQIMGPENDAYCRHEVLGEPMPTPEFETAAGISSPVPFGAARVRGGGRTAQIGRVAVTLRPDATSTERSMRGKAKTTIRFNRADITWRRNRQGVVTRINGPAAPTATIQTTYGPGTSADMPSGYGRGTTEADIQAGTTSLGFHEGRHGVDFLRFMANNPFPVFAAAPGMTETEVRAAAEAYHEARRVYIETIQRLSVEATDCVGDTDLVSAEVRVICDAAHAGHGHGTTP